MMGANFNASMTTMMGATILKGADDAFFRIREGDYRIIYTVEDKKLIVLVLRIGHRSEVYRNL